MTNNNKNNFQIILMSKACKPLTILLVFILLAFYNNFCYAVNSAISVEIENIGVSGPEIIRTNIDYKRNNFIVYFKKNAAVDGIIYKSELDVDGKLQDIVAICDEKDYCNFDINQELLKKTGALVETFDINLFRTLNGKNVQMPLKIIMPKLNISLINSDADETKNTLRLINKSSEPIKIIDISFGEKNGKVTKDPDSAIPEEIQPDETIDVNIVLPVITNKQEAIKDSIIISYKNNNKIMYSTVIITAKPRENIVQNTLGKPLAGNWLKNNKIATVGATILSTTSIYIYNKLHKEKKFHSQAGKTIIENTKTIQQQETDLQQLKEHIKQNIDQVTKDIEILQKAIKDLEQKILAANDVIQKKIINCPRKTENIINSLKKQAEKLQSETALISQNTTKKIDLTTLSLLANAKLLKVSYEAKLNAEINCNKIEALGKTIDEINDPKLSCEDTETQTDFTFSQSGMQTEVLSTTVETQAGTTNQPTAAQTDFMLPQTGVQTDILGKPVEAQTDFVLPQAEVQTEVLSTTVETQAGTTNQPAEAQTDFMLPQTEVQTEFLGNNAETQTDVKLGLLMELYAKSPIHQVGFLNSPSQNPIFATPRMLSFAAAGGGQPRSGLLSSAQKRIQFSYNHPSQQLTTFTEQPAVQQTVLDNQAFVDNHKPVDTKSDSIKFDSQNLDNQGESFFKDGNTKAGAIERSKSTSLKYDSQNLDDQGKSFFKDDKSLLKTPPKFIKSPLRKSTKQTDLLK